MLPIHNPMFARRRSCARLTPFVRATSLRFHSQSKCQGVLRLHRSDGISTIFHRLRYNRGHRLPPVTQPRSSSKKWRLIRLPSVTTCFRQLLPPFPVCKKIPASPTIQPCFLFMNCILFRRTFVLLFCVSQFVPPSFGVKDCPFLADDPTVLCIEKEDIPEFYLPVGASNDFCLDRCAVVGLISRHTH